MTFDNPFLAFAETIAPARKRRQKIVSRRETARQEKALRERDQLFRAYKHHRKNEINALVAGLYGPDAQTLLDFLAKPHSASDLVEHVQSGPWRDADADTRFLVFALIDAAITRQRERQGLPPFDDPLPDEPLSAFLELKAWLR
jgi:hypothetical protein